MPDATDTERQREVEQRDALYKLPHHRAKYRREIAEALVEQFQATSIGCFAGSPIDVRMWAYYASGHGGYCLGFSFDPPWVYVDSAGRHFRMQPEKVRYSETYPEVASEADFREDAEASKLATSALLTKAKGWESESEWRCFRPATPSGHQTFEPSALRTVVLGARMPSRKREEIIALVSARESKVELFQAETAPKSFEIVLARIDP